MIMGSSRELKEDAEDRGPPGLEGLEEADCVLLALEGSRPAQAELVRRHMDSVFRVCCRLLGSRERAADATQEAFLRAFQALDGFDRRRSFRAWVSTIAWNYVRDEFRRMRFRRTVSLSALEERELFEPEDESLARPEEILEKSEDLELVDEAMGRLDFETRTLLTLRELEGFSYLEIAEVFGWKLGTVKSRVHRARMALKDAFFELRPSSGGDA